MKARLKEVLFKNHYDRMTLDEETLNELAWFVTDKADDIEAEWESHYHTGKTCCKIGSITTDKHAALADKFGDYYVYGMRFDDSEYEAKKERLLINDWEMLEKEDLDTVVVYRDRD
jgi:hypothetical protein